MFVGLECKVASLYYPIITSEPVYLIIMFHSILYATNYLSCFPIPNISQDSRSISFSLYDV
jgi:hypothetical protein